jgi:hypothetical protein
VTTSFSCFWIFNRSSGKNAKQKQTRLWMLIAHRI